MLAKELVTILEENNPDYSRQTLLNEINYVQRTIFGAANMYTMATDSATGLDPKITPTTTEYVISDALRIDRVYKYNFSLPEPVRIVGDTVYFQESRLGQDYFIRYYTKLQELTSETMEISVPDEYIDVLEDGVEERLSSKEHGSKEGWRAWKRYDMAKLQRKLNNNYRWGKPDGTQKISSHYGAIRRTAYCT